jgi:hypothetical protein
VNSLSLENFIYTVKKELLDSQQKHEDELAYFNLEKVDLEVNVTTKLGGDGKINVAVAQLGSKISRDNTHVVRLSFSIVEQPPSEDTPREPTPKKRVRRGGKKYARR